MIHGGWRRIHVFWGFSFFPCLILYFEAEHTWLVASSADNMLHPCLLQVQITVGERPTNNNRQIKWSSSEHLSLQNWRVSMFSHSYLNSVLTGQKLNLCFHDLISCRTQERLDKHWVVCQWFFFFLSSQCPRSSRAARSSLRSMEWWMASTASLESPQISRNCGRRYTLFIYL